MVTCIYMCTIFHSCLHCSETQGTTYIPSSVILILLSPRSTILFHTFWASRSTWPLYSGSFSCLTFSCLHHMSISYVTWPFKKSHDIFTYRIIDIFGMRTHTHTEVKISIPHIPLKAWSHSCSSWRILECVHQSPYHLRRQRTFLASGRYVLRGGREKICSFSRTDPNSVK